MMSQDGADLGVDAGTALSAVFGGDQPSEKSHRSPDQMRAYLMEQTGPSDYGGTAAYVGKLIFEALLEDPHRATYPMNTEYDWDAIHATPDYDVETMRAHTITKSLDDHLREEKPELMAEIDALGITGFMWGWAVNAARYCVELQPQPNPAIVSIG